MNHTRHCERTSGNGLAIDGPGVDRAHGEPHPLDLIAPAEDAKPATSGLQQ